MKLCEVRAALENSYASFAAAKHRQGLAPCHAGRGPGGALNGLRSATDGTTDDGAGGNGGNGCVRTVADVGAWTSETG